MFGAIASGESVVRTPLRGQDCEATLHCLAQMGLSFDWIAETALRLRPIDQWTQPEGPLDCGNSGTTMRLMAGLIASRPLDVTMLGDESLSRRPMKRIAEPLKRMGATIEGDTPPLHIVGGKLQGIQYDSPVASAQIKSCTLLAGLRAEGPTRVTEPELSRDHTERLLRAMGAEITTGQTADGRSFAELQPASNLQPFEFSVPADISSAAFLLVAGALLAGEDGVEAKDVGVNPTRIGLLHVLRSIGAEVQVTNERTELGEPVADLRVHRAKAFQPFKVDGKLVPMLVDEIPVLAVLATQCEGTSTIRQAAELRVKESDRIEAMSEGLRRMGAQVETFEDGMAITGPTELKGIEIDAKHDHRIAMAFAIAGLLADGQTTISGAESILTSYPTFEEDLGRLVHV